MYRGQDSNDEKRVHQMLAIHSKERDKTDGLISSRDKQTWTDYK